MYRYVCTRANLRAVEDAVISANRAKLAQKGCLCIRQPCAMKKGNEILVDTCIYFPWESRFGQIKKPTAVRVFCMVKVSSNQPQTLIDW